MPGTPCAGVTPTAPEHNAQEFTSDGFHRTGELASRRFVDGVEHLTIEERIERGGQDAPRGLPRWRM